LGIKNRILTGKKIEVVYMRNEISWRKTILEVYRDRNGMLYNNERGLSQEIKPSINNWTGEHADLSEYVYAFPYHMQGGYKAEVENGYNP
jgi:hypothetical protein